MEAHRATAGESLSGFSAAHCATEGLLGGRGVASLSDFVEYNALLGRRRHSERRRNVRKQGPGKSISAHVRDKMATQPQTRRTSFPNPAIEAQKKKVYSNNYMNAHTAPPKQTAVDTLVTTPTDTGFWAQAKPNIPSSANAKPMNVNKMQKLWQRLSR